MITYIALLRGINVSGQRKIPMAELRSLLGTLKFESVQTYIQSGNVIFQASEIDVIKLERLIKEAILKHFGFEVPILIKTAIQIQSIIDSCPFSEEKKEKSYFTLLHKIPDSNLVASINKLDYPNEEFVFSENCVYFFSERGYGSSKCNNIFFERKLKVAATTRNYKTMIKLLALSNA